MLSKAQWVKLSRELAQYVEHRMLDPKVDGASPSLPTNTSEVVVSKTEEEGRIVIRAHLGYQVSCRTFLKGLRGCA